MSKINELTYSYETICRRTDWRFADNIALTMNCLNRKIIAERDKANKRVGSTILWDEYGLFRMCQKIFEAGLDWIDASALMKRFAKAGRFEELEKKYPVKHRNDYSDYYNYTSRW